MPAPSILYFDLGRVLLDFSAEQMCRQVAEVAGVSPSFAGEAMIGTEEGRTLLVRFETGLADEDEFYAGLCRLLGCTPDRERLATAAADIFTPIQPVWELVARLAAAENRLGLLTNTNSLHWRFITDGRYPLLATPGGDGSPFRHIVASHLVGAMKPDPAIYRHAIERAAVPAGEIFFVDDNLDNVLAAQDAGLDAVQFTDPAALIEALQTRGVRGA